MNNFFYKSKAIKCYFRLIKLVIENDILTKFKYKKLVNNFVSQKSEMHSLIFAEKWDAFKYYDAKFII